MRVNIASERVKLTERFMRLSTGRYRRFTSDTVAVTVPTVSVGS